LPEWLSFSRNTVFKEWQGKIIMSIKDCVLFKLATKPQMKSRERLPRYGVFHPVSANFLMVPIFLICQKDRGAPETLL